MAKIIRKPQKIFAGNATNNGVFGSLQSGDKQLSNDVETIQSLPAYEEGWNAATISSEKLPPLEEFQGIQYANSYQLAYLLQEGIPEWDSNTTYYQGAVCKVLGYSGNFILYSSLTDDNTGNHPATSTSSWKSVFNTEFPFATENWVKDWVNSNYVQSNTFGNCITSVKSSNWATFSGAVFTTTADITVKVPVGRNSDNGIPLFTSATIKSGTSSRLSVAFTNLGIIFYDLNNNTFYTVASIDLLYNKYITEPITSFWMTYDSKKNLYFIKDVNSSTYREVHCVPIGTYIADTSTSSITSIELYQPNVLATMRDVIDVYRRPATSTPAGTIYYNNSSDVIVAPTSGLLRFNSGIPYSSYYYIIINGQEARLNISYDNANLVHVYLILKNDNWQLRGTNINHIQFIPFKPIS